MLLSHGRHKGILLPYQALFTYKEVMPTMTQVAKKIPSDVRAAVR